MVDYPTTSQVLMYRFHRGAFLRPKADVAAKRRDSIAQGAAQRNPGLAEPIKTVALKGRHSCGDDCGRRAIVCVDIIRRDVRGNHALSGLPRAIASEPRVPLRCTLGCRI